MPPSCKDAKLGRIFHQGDLQPARIFLDCWVVGWLVVGSTAWFANAGTIVAHTLARALVGTVPHLLAIVTVVWSLTQARPVLANTLTVATVGAVATASGLVTALTAPMTETLADLVDAKTISRVCAVVQASGHGAVRSFVARVTFTAVVATDSMARTRARERTGGERDGAVGTTVALLAETLA